MDIGMKAACAAAALALAAQAAASPTCWTPREVESARVRDLQTIMMVGALRCSAAGYNTAFGYDRFVVRHRGELSRHNDILKARFHNAAGRAAGNRDYDAFTTALANAHSAESSDMRSYCDRVDWLVRTAVSVPSDELVLFAEEISERPHGVGQTCPADERRRVAVPAALPPALPPVEPTPPRVEVAGVPAPDIAVNPVVAPAVPAPVQTASAEPAPQADPDPVATAEALRQATAALKAATAALEAAMAARPTVAPKPIPASAPAAPIGVTGPRRAPVTPTVLEPSPVVPPEALPLVG